MNRVRVKICGVTTASDALLALDCGADALGLNFYAKSPRCLNPGQAAELVQQLPPFSTTIGVIVDLSPEAALQLAQDVLLSGLQTYDSAHFGQVRQPLQHLAAYRVADALQLQQVDQELAQLQAKNLLPDAVLIDSYVPGEMGGTGHKAPWHLLANFKSPVPLILAGGLTPDNVAQAIEQVRPWGVDVASGVESAPGQKDPAKVRAFLQAVRTVTLPTTSLL